MTRPSVGVDPLGAGEAVLGDRLGMAYSGTLVTHGQGTGIVVGTGADTEIGRISRLVAQVETLTTPLLRQMATFSRWLTGAVLGLAVLIFLFGTLWRGMAPGETFMTVVCLAVAAIPEGLPAILTVTLAIAAQLDLANADEAMISGFLLWRIALVAALMAAGVFGIFRLALAEGVSLEVARTYAVNTLVLMEIVYLFSVRFLRTPSLTWERMFNSRAAILAVGVVALLQLTFTYAPFMERFFDTRPVDFVHGVEIVLIGVGLFAVLELEKL